MMLNLGGWYWFLRQREYVGQGKMRKMDVLFP